jgi:hypothetical protein
MDLEQARRIVAEEDKFEPALALEAVAVILRFHGVSDPRFVGIAESLESVAAELAAGQSRQGDQEWMTAGRYPTRPMKVG